MEEDGKDDKYFKIEEDYLLEKMGNFGVWVMPKYDVRWKQI